MKKSNKVHTITIAVSTAERDFIRNAARIAQGNPNVSGFCRSVVIDYITDTLMSNINLPQYEYNILEKCWREL